MRFGPHHASVFAAAVVFSCNALASLGASVDSVESDRAVLQATRHSSVSGLFTMHALTRPDGSVVREYSTASGTVVAVVWTGKSLPNLAQIFGAQYFNRWVAALQGHRVGRRVAIMQEADVVIESRGAMRHSFSGRAYLTSALSAGITPDQFQ